MKIDMKPKKLIFPHPFFLVFAFYILNFDVVLASIKWSSPVYQFSVAGLLLFLCSRVKAFQGKSLLSEMAGSMLFKWNLFLVFVSLIFCFKADQKYSEVGLLLLASTFLITVSLKMASVCLDKDVDYGRALSILLLLSSVLVIVDPIVDIRSYFDSQQFYEYERTRGGGLYFQPNIASVVLVFLLAAALPRCSGGGKVLLCCVSSFAVFLTFSRSGLILLSLLLIISVWRKYISRLTFAIFCAIPVFLFGAESIGEGVASVFNIDEGSGYIRMYEMQEMLSEGGIKGDSRTETAATALEDFINEPFGRGLGFSWKWAEMQPEGQGTHNLNLRYMLEFGIVGIFIWPFFVFSLYSDRVKGLDKLWSIGVLGMAVLSSLFSHNMTEQGAVLASMYAVFALPLKNKCLGR